MKEKVEVTFGNLNEEAKTKEVTVPIKEDSLFENQGIHEELETVKKQPVVEEASKSEVEEDLYAEAVDTIFGEYQAFQEGMNGLTKMLKQPGLMQLTLNKLLSDFKEAIDTFKSGTYDIEEVYQEGHQHILTGLQKYETFLVEYPKALQGKSKMKSMAKITSLGKLSGEADQDMKQAFRSFEKAIEEMEAGETNE